jgi:hypothetical protein
MLDALAKRRRVSSLTRTPTARILAPFDEDREMRKLILIAALVAPAGALMVPNAALAESRANADAKRMGQLICRPIKETGSRLSKKRICMTREQWAEQKRIMRTDLNQAQTRRNEPQSN